MDPQQAECGLDSAQSSCCDGTHAMGAHYDGSLARYCGVGSAGEQDNLCHIVQRSKESHPRRQRVDVHHRRCLQWRQETTPRHGGAQHEQVRLHRLDSDSDELGV
uniref:Uncharacterized protein n=1 Tax=Cacopsylla melanoneura TaxID=428564 RepID=A0A8D8W8X1_9HEMI